MQFLNTLSFAPDVNNWLANARRPRILHVFERACNLIDERGEVLSIVTPQIGNGPFNLVIEDDSLVFSNLNVKSSISISPNQLTIADSTIRIAHAELWKPRPDWEWLHVRKDEIFNQLLLLPALDFQPSIPKFLTSKLSSMLVNQDISTAKKTASKLAGLGFGLTPAGDDYILGGLLAVWLIHPPGFAKKLASEIAKTAASLTTSLSAAWLKSAGRGEAGVLWHDFFDALGAADFGSIQYAREKILAVGETSGFDSMLGFINTFSRWQEMKSLQLQRITP